MPGAEQAAENDEFAEVVGVVVGDKEGFAEKVLAVAPAEGFEEIGVGLLMSAMKCLRSLWMAAMDCVPGVGRGWLWRFWPVAVGPLDGVVAAGGRRARS